MSLINELRQSSGNHAERLNEQKERIAKYLKRSANNGEWSRLIDPSYMSGNEENIVAWLKEEGFHVIQHEGDMYEISWSTHAEAGSFTNYVYECINHARVADLTSVFVETDGIDQSIQDEVFAVLGEKGYAVETHTQNGFNGKNLTWRKEYAQSL